MPQTPKRVLVVEDDDAIRIMAAEALTLAGYTVEQAPSGRLGLAALLDRPPAVIVLDLTMPDMDGWSFCAAKQRHPAVAQIPIVVVSAAAGAVEHARVLGAAAALVKPFEIDRLLATVAIVLPGEPRRATPGRTRGEIIGSRQPSPLPRFTAAS